MRVANVVTKQGNDIAELINAFAGDQYADLLTAICSAESNLDELSTRNGTWPDVSGGLTHVIARNLGYTQDNLQPYWDFIHDRFNALQVGWKYLQAAIGRMGGDPLYSLLSYNKGPMYSKDQLISLRQTDPEIERRFEYYEAHYNLIQKYVTADMAPYTFHQSPNYNTNTIKPVGICDHITDGPYDGAVSWLTNSASQVSAHFVVAKDGRVVQLVKLTDRAWAQGVTRPDVSIWTPLFPKTENPNGYLISIEHEGKPGDAYFMNPVQYDASLGVHIYVAQTLGWSSVNRNMIVGHYQFDAVNRANCPSSAFPFDRLINDINAALSGEDMATIAELQAQIQQIQGQLDQQTGINKTLQEQLDYVQQLKFQVEDSLTKQVAALNAQVVDLQRQLANAQNNTADAALLAELRDVLKKLMATP